MEYEHDYKPIRSYDVGVGKGHRQRVKVLEVSDLPEHILKELVARNGHITRNSTCPCGSGHRFKRCCGLGRVKHNRKGGKI